MTSTGAIKMNKGELIANISRSGLMTKVAAKKALDTVIANMTAAMKKGDKVTLSGFGSFRVIEMAARKGRNPRTGQALVIPGRRVVKFKPARKLSEKVQ